MCCENEINYKSFEFISQETHSVPMCFQELILHVADTSVAKRIFIRVTGYHDLYKRSRNPDTELLGQIIEEAAEQRKEEEKLNS